MNAIGSKRKQVPEETGVLGQREDSGERRSRFTESLAEFSAGSAYLLNHAQFSKDLAVHLTKLLSQGHSVTVIELIKRVETCLCAPDPHLREHALSTVVEFSGGLAGANNSNIIPALFRTLVKWFETEEEQIKGYGLGCSQLHKLTQRLFESSELWEAAVPLIIVLQKINEGQIEKQRALRDMAVKLQDSLATRSILHLFLTCYLNDKSEKRQTAEVILTHLGRRSIVHMVNVLMHADSKEDRLQLISLIPKAGTCILTVLDECLQRDPPWYVVRNLIFIISELPDPAAFVIARPYLSYGDIRVQQQVVRCIVRNSGEYYEERMIDALFSVHDELKMPIIMQLAQMRSTIVARSLLDLLASRQSFEKEHYIELLVRICRAFHLCSSQEVIPALHGLITERQVHVGPSDPVILAALDALFSLQENYADAVAEVLAATDLSSNGFSYRKVTRNKRSTRRTTFSVKEMVERGDLENAGKKLFANAVSAARDNDFASAELLRDKILEISPLALSEVIRLGEIIEEEKSSSISSHHIAVWSELYEKLTTKEFSALYFAMKQARYNEDDLIVSAGDTRPCLYFINSGVIALSCLSENRETVLKELSQGDVVGVSPFFDFSVWTVTMKARTAALVHVLFVPQFRELENQFPGIEGKLHDYCLMYDTVPQLLRMAGSDRRVATRYPVSVNISNMLLDPYGNVGKRIFKGELIDVSRGGLRFTVTISNRENARLLLGRQIISIIEIDGREKLRCFGVIVGGRFREEGGQQFIVHVNFHHQLEQSSVALITGLEMQDI